MHDAPRDGGAAAILERTEATWQAGNTALPSRQQPTALLVEAEMALARRSFLPHYRDHLHALGIEDGALYGMPCYGRLAGHFGHLRVTFDSDGFFEPSEDGVGALVIGLHDMVPSWGIVDLVALSVRENRFGLRTGTVSIAGLANVEHARQANEPVVVFDGPLPWLQSGCEGCAILNWRGPLLHHLDGCRLLAADPETGRRLSETLERAANLPTVRVRRAA